MFFQGTTKIYNQLKALNALSESIREAL